MMVDRGLAAALLEAGSRAAALGTVGIAFVPPAQAAKAIMNVADSAPAASR
ncbi:MAG: hypothetical protein ACYDGW_04835 [Vulcanimicrobiaceae bacterium]